MNHVVPTAGHVDHGKSAVVRALTGRDPDRWAAEKRRGLPLDLGFAWTDLVGPVAFVDAADGGSPSTRPGCRTVCSW